MFHGTYVIMFPGTYMLPEHMFRDSPVPMFPGTYVPRFAVPSRAYTTSRLTCATYHMLRM